MKLTDNAIACVLTYLNYSIKVILMNFRMAVDKAARQAVLQAFFFKSMITFYRICWCLKYFSYRILRLKITSVVLSSSEPSVFFNDYFFCFVPVQDDFQPDLWGWCFFLQKNARLLFLGCIIISDRVHEIDHSPVLQILLQFSVKTSVMDYLPAWTNSAGILFTPTDPSFFGASSAI